MESVLMKRFLHAALLLTLVSSTARAQINAGSLEPESDLPFTMTQVATFNLPWQIAFLPDVRMLVTEKVGPVWLVTQQGQKTQIIAPGNLTFYNGPMFPQWRGSALMGGMATQTLNRMTFDGNGGAAPAERWNVGHRIRDVEVAADGALWMLEDANPGGLFRVTPKQPSSR
jgi:glucose/arabinose dehydrogenase